MAAANIDDTDVRVVHKDVFISNIDVAAYIDKVTRQLDKRRVHNDLLDLFAAVEDHYNQQWGNIMFLKILGTKTNTATAFLKMEDSSSHTKIVDCFDGAWFGDRKLRVSINEKEVSDQLYSLYLYQGENRKKRSLTADASCQTVTSSVIAVDSDMIVLDPKAISSPTAVAAKLLLARNDIATQTNEASYDCDSVNKTLHELHFQHCPVCLLDFRTCANDLWINKCGHVFCESCVKDLSPADTVRHALDQFEGFTSRHRENRCPVCRGENSFVRLLNKHEVFETSFGGYNGGTPATLQPIDIWRIATSTATRVDKSTNTDLSEGEFVNTTYNEIMSGYHCKSCGTEFALRRGLAVTSCGYIVCDIWGEYAICRKQVKKWYFCDYCNKDECSIIKFKI